MASNKKRRKQANAKRPASGKPFVHPDGDRRHRGGDLAREAAADKRARQTFAGGVPEDLPDGKK